MRSGPATTFSMVAPATLAKEGVKTVVTDINPETLADVQREFQESGWEGKAFLCDVRDAAKIQRLLKNNPREVTEADALAIYRAAW